MLAERRAWRRATRGANLTESYKVYIWCIVSLPTFNYGV